MNTDRRAWPTIASAFVVSQALVIGGWFAATIVTRHLLGGDLRPPQYHGFLGWTSWDGGFYRGIAEHGYLASDPEGIRFFPLYPLVARPMAWILGGNTDLALFVVAKVSAIVAMSGIWKLVREEGATESTAARTVWFWVLFPGAFVLGWAYSEALLVALAVWGIRALRRERWWLAAALGLAAGLCRPVGAAFAVAAIAEVVRRDRIPDVRAALARGAAVVAAPVGVALFGTYAAWRGFGFTAPVTLQDELRGTQTPFQRLWSLPSTFSGHDAFTTALHVPFVVLFLVLLVVTFRKLPASYGLFAAAILVAALSAENLNSIERYATSAFPLAMAGALVLDRYERFEPALYAVGGGLSITFTTLALTGAFVP